MSTLIATVGYSCGDGPLSSILNMTMSRARIRAGGRSDMQAQAGLALARDLKAVESKYLTESSLTRDILDATVGMSDGIPFT